jgi:hypothetical protein
MAQNGKTTQFWAKRIRITYILGDKNALKSAIFDVFSVLAPKIYVILILFPKIE